MPGEVFGVASYPNITDFVSCSYTCSHGITPGVATLNVPAGQLGNLQPTGDLKITDGRVTVELKDCKIDAAKLSGGKGFVYTIPIFDRRWKWAFSEPISGHYGERDPLDGKVKPETIKSPRELAELCLEAMGETDYEIEEMPEPDNIEQNLEVVWDNVNSAQALAELVEPLGFRVVFQPIQNRVLIAKLGEGDDLPKDDYTDLSPGVDVPERPDSFQFVGADEWFQVALPLEAVGQEPNGRIKPIDELSYKPTQGWNKTVPPYFSNVTIPASESTIAAQLLVPGITISPATRAEYQDLAKRTVYRWYRIKCENPDGSKPLKIPGYDGPEIKDIKDIFLGPGIVTNEPYRLDEQYAIHPARVYGIYYKGEANYRTNTPAIGSNTQSSALMSGEQFTIDPERRIIAFDKYMFRIGGATGVPDNPLLPGAAQVSVSAIYPAFLIAVISIRLRDPETRGRRRFTFTKQSDDPSSSNGTGPLLVKNEQGQLNHVCRYNPANWVVSDVTDNRDEAEKIATYYINGAIARLETKESIEVGYPGIKDIEPNGKIQQVTWSVGGLSPATTRASSNTEHAPYLPPYPQRRTQERLKAVFDNNPRPVGGPSRKE